jgi:hypothetical protein
MDRAYCPSSQPISPNPIGRDELRKHDIMSLMTLVPTATNKNVKYDPKRPSTFPSLIGLTCIRGCEVEGFLDQEGNVCIRVQAARMVSASL